MQKMSLELEKCSAVMNVVNEMKSREEMLVAKVFYPLSNPTELIVGLGEGIDSPES